MWPFETRNPTHERDMLHYHHPEDVSDLTKALFISL